MALLLGAAAPPPVVAESPVGATAIFDEVAVESGLDFVHRNGRSGRFYFPEVMGAGGALVDVDNDGDLDVFLAQGAMLGPDLAPGDALYPPRPGEPPGDRLFRNDLERGAAGDPVLAFTDVTERSGIGGAANAGYSMGVAAGDYDNDGWVDLYVTRLGPNRLLRNQRDGTFRDVTAASGTGDELWSVSATFADFDGDGWLDLAVANYVRFSYLEHKVCLSKRGERGYCLPTSFEPSPARLYRNRGDGTFEDVSTPSGLQAVPGNGLGILTTDFDQDGRLDLLVANDLLPNRLWRNQGGLTFVDEALLAGCALNGDGRAEASMGIDAGDADGDGDDDLFLTKFDGETNTLYRNDGGLFADATAGSGLGEPSFRYTGIGTRFLDYDNDGRLDLAVTNGRVVFPPGADLARDPYPMEEPNLLFHGVAGGFRDSSAEGGAQFQRAEVGRGLATGDVDNDGDTDLLVTSNSGPARLFLNGVGQRRSWLGLRLLAATAPRDAPGAVVIATTGDDRVLRRRAAADGSYASSSDPRVLLGLGDGGTVASLQVRWPDGTVERWDPPPLGAYATLGQGTGRRR